MTLANSIEILTREHKTMAHTIDGLEVHTRPALLHLLREAVFGGMESTGGSSLKAKLPISEAALDLYQLIDHQIAEAWAQVHNTPPSTDLPEALVAQWSALVGEDVIVTVTTPEQHERRDETKGHDVPYVVHARQEYTAHALAARWVDQITEFFDPPRQAQITAACIQCGTEKVTRRKDGQDVITGALVFRRDRDTGRTLDATCLACGTVWPPSQFDFLANALGITIAEIIDDKERVREPGQRLSEQCDTGHHTACASLACRCAHHTETERITPGPATPRRSGPAHTALTEPSTELTPITRDVCTDCWTEKSITGACMCTR